MVLCLDGLYVMYVRMSVRAGITWHFRRLVNWPCVWDRAAGVEKCVGGSISASSYEIAEPGSLDPETPVLYIIFTYSRIPERRGGAVTEDL